MPPPAAVFNTPVSRPSEIYHSGANRLARNHMTYDPVEERPLYDPTETATRDWYDLLVRSMIDL